LSRRTVLKDETVDRDSTPASVHPGGVTGQDDLSSVAGGESEPSSPPHNDTRPTETVGSQAAHRRWMVIAAACAVAAAVLLFTVGVNAAFVVAVLGAVAWFWDQRNRIRADIIEDENSEEGRGGLEEFDDESGYDNGRRRSRED